jgi:uncharacterized protein YyaL (SSP411 family)
MASGNGIAARALARLGWLVGEPRFLDAAESTIRGAWQSLLRVPHAHAAMLNALDEYLEPVEIVVIRGSPPDLSRWSTELGAIHAPRRMVLAIPADARDLPDSLAAKIPRDRPVAYVCHGPSCSEPVSDLAGLSQAAHEKRTPHPE